MVGDWVCIRSGGLKEALGEPIKFLRILRKLHSQHYASKEIGSIMKSQQYLSTNIGNQYFIQMTLDTVYLISRRSNQLILISQRVTPAETDNIILELEQVH